MDKPVKVDSEPISAKTAARLLAAERLRHLLPLPSQDQEPREERLLTLFNVERKLY